MIDETTRYTFAGHVKSKRFEDLRDCLLQGWFRYFGPPKIFLSDQESSLAGEDFGRLCDKFNVERWLAGSDPHHLGRGGKHTTTGLAEKHIDLTKLTMLKLQADVSEAGLPAAPEELAAEVMLAQNTLLSYGGVTPPMAVIGVSTRDVY